MFKKKFKSLDKNYTAEIFLKKPDKYREIEKISSSLDNIITMGSCNSYTPASFKEDNVSIDLKKFNRIIEFDKENKLKKFSRFMHNRNKPTAKLSKP